MKTLTKQAAFDTCLARYTSKGGNEAQGRALLEEALEAHATACNLGSALNYLGFATVAHADKLAAKLLEAEAA